MPMLHNFSQISYLVGNESILANIANVPILPMFSEQMKDFLYNLSAEILKDKRTKLFADVSSYAFWIRKAHIQKAQPKFHNIENRVGRGVAFHIAPSNVPVNFAVSFTSALLAGNPCVVRVSNKEFEQVSIICNAINKVIQNDMPKMQKYICIIRYEHSTEITQMLSSMCDIRIIWGGNETINEVRKAKLPPRAIEMTFADRHSLSIINADEYLQADFDKISKGFYIDTYFTDQNACSSPRLVVWTGNNIKEAQKIFWQKLEDKVKKEYEFKAIQAINKIDSFCKFAATHKNVSVIKNSNYVVRIQIKYINENLMDYKDNSGFFFEYETQNLEDIVPILTKPCQTISYYGIDKAKIKELVLKFGTKGVDRIVEIGDTMNLSFIWDGYNMIEAMTRLIYIGSEYEI